MKKIMKITAITTMLLLSNVAFAGDDNSLPGSKEEAQKHFIFLYYDCVEYLLKHPETWNMNANEVEYPSCKKLLQLEGDALAGMMGLGKK